MKYTGEYQRPAKGIMQSMDLDKYKSYHIECECTTAEHSVDACIEVNSDKDTQDVECTFYVTTWTPLFSTRFERLKAAFMILYTGIHKQEHTLLLNKQAALNLAETLKMTINELEKK